MTQYITRQQWGARPPKSVTPMPKPVRTVYVHHSVTPLLADPATTVRQIQAQHMDRQGWNDIGYQELVAHTGDVYEGRGFAVQGGATRGENSTSLAICALGNFEAMVPPSALLDSIVARIVAAARSGALAPGFQIQGHRDANSTACPGQHLYERLPAIRLRVAAALSATRPKGDDVYHLYKLHKDALNAGEAQDWVVPPNGPKFACGSTHYLDDLARSGAIAHDLTGDVDASRVFRNAHP